MYCYYYYYYYYWLWLARLFSCQFVIGTSIGSAGGILLLWEILCFCGFEGYLKRFSLGSYFCFGPDNATDRVDFWLVLTQVAHRWIRPWVLGGDFIVFRFPPGRKGGFRYDHEGFLWLDSSADLIDLRLSSSKYTWSNTKEVLMMSRLFWFLVSTKWLDLFPDYVQRTLAQPVSDCCPILLETGTEDWGPPPPRFGIIWLDEKDFRQHVKD